MRTYDTVPAERTASCTNGFERMGSVEPCSWNCWAWWLFSDHKICPLLTSFELSKPNCSAQNAHFFARAACACPHYWAFLRVSPFHTRTIVHNHKLHFSRELFQLGSVWRVCRWQTWTTLFTALVEEAEACSRHMHPSLMACHAMPRPMEMWYFRLLASANEQHNNHLEVYIKLKLA